MGLNIIDFFVEGTRAAPHRDDIIIDGTGSCAIVLAMTPETLNVLYREQNLISLSVKNLIMFRTSLVVKI